MNKLCIISGEASGDHHAADLAKSVLAKSPETVICGSGGDRLQKLTKGEFVQSAHLNATGITEVLALLPQYFQLMKDITQMIRKEHPDAVVFVDNPGLNFRIAKEIAGLGIPMHYYICPQVWAWKAKRVHVMKRLFEKRMVIFEFEKLFFESQGVHVNFVGHPLTAQMNRHLPAARNMTRNSSAKKILLLPGSRNNEIRRLLPVMLEAAQKLHELHPDTVWTVMKADTVDSELFDAQLKAYPFIKVVSHEGKYNQMLEHDAAISCSGTVTLECAMMGLPMIILYKASWLTGFIGRMVVKVKFLGLPNLLADREICPELLMDNCTVGRVVAAFSPYMTDSSKIEESQAALLHVTSSLAAKNASDEAANLILDQ